jgi:outer membrane protein OmpA-like peptidoglycan-associated protein
MAALALCGLFAGCSHSAKNDSDACPVVIVAHKPNPVIVGLGYDDIRDRRGTVDYPGGYQHVLYIPSEMRVPATDAATADGVVRTDSETVYFLFNRVDIRKSEKDRMDAFIAGIGVSNIDSILVGGHTDSIGSYEYNIRLSERRANAVRDYLAGMGIGTDKITTAGYGEGVPIASNGNEIGRQKNRRSEIKIGKDN